MLKREAQEQHDDLGERADTPQSVAIHALMDLAQHSLDDSIRLESARALLDR